MRSLCSVLVALSIAGCTPAPMVSAPNPPTRYYGVTTKIEGTTAAEGATNIGGPEDPTKMLEPGSTVAFFPPDQCATTTDAPDRSRPKERQIVLLCGSLLQKLEQAAVRAGYQVASWQNLKSNDTLARARELEVDYLFEINEFGINDAAVDAHGVTNMEFFEQSSQHERKPLMLADVTAAGMRCKEPLSNLVTGTEASLSATMSLKLVSVKDGRAKWFYERTIGEERQAKTAYELYYPASPKVDMPPPPNNYAKPIRSGWTLVGVGLGFMAVGIAGLVLGGRAEGSGRTAALALGGTFTALGSLSTLGGGAMLGYGYGKREREYKNYKAVEPTVTYPAPEVVLCNSPAVAHNPYGPPPMAAEAPTVKLTGSQVSFEESQSVGKDPQEVRKNELLGRLVDDLFGTMKGGQAPVASR